MSNKKVLVFVANGSEEIEALSVVNILRRADIEVNLCSIAGDNTIIGSHNIKIITDTVFKDINIDEYDSVVIPGGLPGAYNLRDSSDVVLALKTFNEKGRLCAAICAGPIVLAKAGIIKGINVTSYPAEDFINPIIDSGAIYSDKIVEKDKNIITARGPATTMYFALEILESLLGRDKRIEIENGLLIPLVEKSIKTFN